MAGGWQNLLTDLNTFFDNKTSRGQLGQAFRDKHGNNGHGGGNKPPYSLGRFLENGKKPGSTTDDILTDRQKGQFLIDSGPRHWDAQSLMNIEEAIRRNLTRRGSGPNPFDEKKIIFKVQEQMGATRATATITEVAATPTQEAHTLIEIKCPPANLTTP
jgi:hypothetical protein